MNQMIQLRNKLKTGTYLPLLIYTLLGLLFSLPVLYTSDLMLYCAIPEKYTRTVIICGTGLSCLCFLLICQKLLRRVFTICRSFRKLPRATGATVSIEFLLVIPLMLCFILTIFALAEIAHAQIIFRYAAYSAMRSGVIANYNANDNIFLYKFELSDTIKENMKLAAAIPLSTLDLSQIKSSSQSSSNTANIAKLYYDIGTGIKKGKDNKNAWKNKALIEKNIDLATKALDITEISANRDSKKNILPMAVDLRLTFEFPVRPGSIFWIVAHRYQKKYPCITLRRTCSADKISTYTMLSTGQRYDMPKIKLTNIKNLIPIFKSMSIIAGDSTRKDID